MNLDRRKAIVAIALAAALSAGAAALIGDVARFSTIAAAVRRVDVARAVLCLVAELGAYAGYALAYRTVAAVAGGPLLRYRDAVSVVTLGFGAYLVGSAAGSLGIDFYAMRKAGARMHEAVRRSLALNTLDASGLALFAVVAGVVVLVRGDRGAAFVMAAAWVGAVSAAVAAAAYLTSPERARRYVARTDEPAPRLERRSLASWRRWLRVEARRVRADTLGGVVLVRQVMARPLRYAGGAFGYPLYWLANFAILWLALDAFGERLDPALVVVAEATAWLLTLLPLPAGGSGAAEASTTFTLHAVGVPLHDALPAALLYRVVSFWLPLVPALLLVPRLRRLQKSLEQSPRAEPDMDPALRP